MAVSSNAPVEVRDIEGDVMVTSSERRSCGHPHRRFGHGTNQ